MNSKWAWGIAIAAALLLVALLGRAEPLREAMLASVAWAGERGGWGPAAVTLLYVPATVLMLPCSVLTLAAGWTLGVARAAAAVWLGAVLGSTAAFLLSRSWLRGMLEARLGARPRVAALDRALAERGGTLVLLLRLSPLIPYNVLNYALGLTRIRLPTYVAASAIGMLPGTLLYAYLGAAARELGNVGPWSRAPENATTSPAERTLFFVGLAATAAVFIYVSLLARRALRAASIELDAASST